MRNSARRFIIQSSFYKVVLLFADLMSQMKERCYTLESVQVRSINPPDEVMRSMNEINCVISCKIIHIGQKCR
jgi:hypothetical protein